jgi:hypothetical protein
VKSPLAEDLRDRAIAAMVPHVAFDNPSCGSHAPPRVSIEMRALALWFD